MHNVVKPARNAGLSSPRPGKLNNSKRPLALKFSRPHQALFRHYASGLLVVFYYKPSIKMNISTAETGIAIKYYELIIIASYIVYNYLY